MAIVTGGFQDMQNRIRSMYKMCNTYAQNVSGLRAISRTEIPGRADKLNGD